MAKSDIEKALTVFQGIGARDEGARPLGVERHYAAVASHHPFLKILFTT